MPSNPVFLKGHDYHVWDISRSLLGTKKYILKVYTFLACLLTSLTSLVFELLWLMSKNALASKN